MNPVPDVGIGAALVHDDVCRGLVLVAQRQVDSWKFVTADSVISISVTSNSLHPSGGRMRQSCNLLYKEMWPSYKYFVTVSKLLIPFFKSNDA